MPDPNTALILHLQRLSTEDGPGIRTTIFFKGCPLHCWWCHNPESISSHPQVQWIETRCIGCESCLDICPNAALTKGVDGSINIDRRLCKGCGTCVEVCPTNALEMLGMETHLDDLFTELMKDRVYFETSNGGVTASGGEPTLQASFVGSLFKKLQSTGIHTALDTCGACQFQSLEKVLPYTNLILYDLKLWEDDVHLHTTGQGNQRIIRNLISIGNLIRENKINSNIWIRTPLIPNMTTSEENLVKIGTFLHETLGDLVERWELCAFNNLCRDKYRRLDMDWRYKDIPLMNQAELEQCGAFAKSSPFDGSRIFVTGAAKAETDFEK